MYNYTLKNIANNNSDKVKLRFFFALFPPSLENINKKTIF